MKTLLRRWILTRELRALARELDYVFDIRRETMRRENHLRHRAEAVSFELTRMELGHHA